MTNLRGLFRRSSLKGHLDTVSGGVLYGWAYDSSQPAGRAVVTVYCDGRPIGKADADIHRPDLEQARIGDGRHGFAFQIPPEAEGELTAHVNGNRLRNRLRVPSFGDFGPHLRAIVAKDFLRGEGLEIGALDKPMIVPEGVRVRRTDRLPAKELRAHYGLQEAAPVDFVCDAHTLEVVGSETQDFVIANHVFEHLENPLLALENWIRVLKPGGVVFMAIPDKGFTFDRGRSVTPLSHLLDERDHPETVAANRHAHYEEWIRDVEHQEGDIRERLEFLLKIDYSIHFHCWTAEGLTELFSAASAIGYEIDCYRFNQPECIFVLKKI